MKELVIKKCLKCGALVEVLKDCTCDNCGIKCCGEEMQKLIPNAVDATAENHMPKCEVSNNEVIVRIDHVMEAGHNIEWIAMVSDNNVCKKFLSTDDEALVIFPYVKGSLIYSYCNKHGLWKTEIE